MKTKSETTEAYVVAGICLVVGVGALRVISKFQAIFHAMLKDKPLPTLTQLLLVPTPWGWLLIFVGLALLVLANERWKWRVPIQVFIIALAIFSATGVVALFLPIVNQPNEVFGG